MNQGKGVPPASGPPEVVVDVATSNNRTIVKGCVGLLIVGVAFTIWAIVLLVGGSSYELVSVLALLVLGLGLTTAGAFPLVMRNKFLRRRAFVFDPVGVRWHDPKGAPWAVRWDELAGLRISSTGDRHITRWVDERPVGTRTYPPLIRVDIRPGDVGTFRTHHPEMEHLWEFDDVRGAYRVPLGPVPELIEMIEGAVRQFDRRGVYFGVVIEPEGRFV